MKKFIFLFLFVSIYHITSARFFVKCTNVAKAGIGSSPGGFTYGSQTPALSLQYEKGVWDIGGPGVIGPGGYAGFKNFQYNGPGYTHKLDYTIYRNQKCLYQFG